MNADDEFLKHRLIELANQCYQRNIPVHSDFLSLYEQNLFHMIEHEIPPVSCKLMGGYLYAERKCVVYVPQEYDFGFTPYDIIEIAPLNKKFAEELTHRDYLGAIMNLGIKREQLGDLVLADDVAYLFCLNQMTDYLIQNLSGVKHTPVMAKQIEADAFHYSPRREEMICSVASIRLDAILSQGFQIARSHAVAYIEEAKVYVNGRLITTNAYNLHEQDLISVRGLGKLQYIGCQGNSKKGRNMIILERFV